MGPRQMKQHCKRFLKPKLPLTSHGTNELLRPPLADLAGKQDIGGNEVLEAIQFRTLDRRHLA